MPSDYTPNNFQGFENKIFMSHPQDGVNAWTARQSHADLAIDM